MILALVCEMLSVGKMFGLSKIMSMSKIMQSMSNLSIQMSDINFDHCTHKWTVSCLT